MARPRLVYLVGVPGAGKSSVLTAVLRLSAERGLVCERREPFPHGFYEADNILRLGYDRPGGFGGTDALSMSVQPVVLRFLSEAQPMHVVGEGDRLGNLSFLDAAQSLGYDVDLVHLDVPEEVAQARREARGSHQNPTWLRGRRSKIENLVGTRPPALSLDGRAPVSGNAALLRAFLGVR